MHVCLSLKFTTIFDKASSLVIATIKKGEMVVPRHPIGIGPRRDKIWLRCSPWLCDDLLGIGGAIPDPDPALSFTNSSAMVAGTRALTDSLTSPLDFFSAFFWFPSFSTGDFPFPLSFPWDVAEALASLSPEISHYNERQLNLHSCSSHQFPWLSHLISYNSALLNIPSTSHVLACDTLTSVKYLKPLYHYTIKFNDHTQ